MLEKQFDYLVWRSLAILRQGGFKMKTVRYMDEDLVIQKGIDLLMKGLGPLEAIRFINSPQVFVSSVEDAPTDHHL